MRRYTIQEVVIVLDENSDVVDWFDTLEDMEKKGLKYLKQL